MVFASGKVDDASIVYIKRAGSMDPMTSMFIQSAKIRTWPDTRPYSL